MNIKSVVFVAQESGFAFLSSLDDAWALSEGVQMCVKLCLIVSVH